MIIVDQKEDNKGHLNSVSKNIPKISNAKKFKKRQKD